MIVCRAAPLGILFSARRLRPCISLSCSREDDRLASKRLVRVLITPEENVSAFSPSFSLGRSNLPWAPTTLRKSTAAKARARDRARGPACAKGAVASTSRGAGTSATARTRNACGEVRRWQAARRQAKRRQDAAAKAQHAQAEKAAPSAGQVRAQGCSETRSYARAWSRSRNFFSPPLCDRPGCYEPPVTSPRNPARYCCPACRQAVRNVLDRERKWLSRGTLDGRKKRAIEYQAARRHRSAASAQRRRRSAAAGTSAMTTLPGCAGRQLSRRLREADLAWASCCSPSGAQA